MGARGKLGFECGKFIKLCKVGGYGNWTGYNKEKGEFQKPLKFNFYTAVSTVLGIFIFIIIKLLNTAEGCTFCHMCPHVTFRLQYKKVAVDKVLK